MAITNGNNGISPGQQQNNPDGNVPFVKVPTLPTDKNYVPPGIPPSHWGGDSQYIPLGGNSNIKILGKEQPPIKNVVDPVNKLPPVQQETPPPTFIDKVDIKWVWNECHQRWYTYHSEPVTFIPGYVEYWTTFEPTTGEWIKVSKWPTEGGPDCKKSGPVIPVDDCIKYGINCPEELSPGKVYTQISSDDVLELTPTLVEYGMWSDNVGTLRNFHISANAQVSESYGIVVYNKEYGTCGSEPQFDIAYGNAAGGGSRDLGLNDVLTPTKAIYYQYLFLCVEPTQRYFRIGNYRMEDIYVINIRRDRYGDAIDAGNIELTLAALSGSEFVAGGGNANAHTGSNVQLAGNGKFIRLIDDSRIDYSLLSEGAKAEDYISETYRTFQTNRSSEAGPFYNIVSGSIEDGIYNPTYPQVYGQVYPRLGIIVLDAARLDASASFATVRSVDVEGDNSKKLFTAISGGAAFTDSTGDELGFTARRQVVEYNRYYYLRVNNYDYNFTNNPTFVSGSDALIKSDFLYNPSVYITSVGLYNSNYELLAVGKISKPIQKNPTSEALLSVHLKYGI